MVAGRGNALATAEWLLRQLDPKEDETMSKRKKDPLVDTHLCQPPRHDDAAPQTHEAEFKGRKVRVTVPENDRPEDLLDDALKENLRPEAVATLANAVRVHVNGRRTNREVRRQLDWLADHLVKLVGGEREYHDLLKEAGL
jgi:hypothetical protein